MSHDLFALESETLLANVLPMKSIARRWKSMAEKLFIVWMLARLPRTSIYCHSVRAPSASSPCSLGLL